MSFLTQLHPRGRDFVHAPIPFVELEAELIDGKRYYTLPPWVSTEKFISVTTALGEHFGTEWVDDWKKRVGEQKALEVSTMALNRGNAMHRISENYILNKPDYLKGEMPASAALFKKIRPILDTHLGTIYGIEVPLYSMPMRLAGRTDLFAEWDGVTSVIDYKTSKKIKTEEDIPSYFLQATIYSLMLEELTDFQVSQLVIVMMVDDEPPIIFKKNTSEFRAEVLSIFSK